MSKQWVGERAKGTTYLEGLKNTMGSQCSKAREGPRPRTVIHKELKHTDRRRSEERGSFLRMSKPLGRSLYCGVLTANG